MLDFVLICILMDKEKYSIIKYGRSIEMILMDDESIVPFWYDIVNENNEDLENIEELGRKLREEELDFVAH